MKLRESVFFVFALTFLSTLNAQTGPYKYYTNGILLLDENSLSAFATMKYCSAVISEIKGISNFKVIQPIYGQNITNFTLRGKVIPFTKGTTLRRNSHIGNQLSLDQLFADNCYFWAMSNYYTNNPLDTSFYSNTEYLTLRDLYFSSGENKFTDNVILFKINDIAFTASVTTTQYQNSSGVPTGTGSATSFVMSSSASAVFIMKNGKTFTIEMNNYKNIGLVIVLTKINIFDCFEYFNLNFHKAMRIRNGSY